MALVSVWIEDGTGYHSYLIDPEAYGDVSPLELKWRILTGCSHRGYLAAHAGMLKRIAARLLSCLAPPKYLALPAPKTERQLQHEAWLKAIKRKAEYQAKRQAAIQSQPQAYIQAHARAIAEQRRRNKPPLKIQPCFFNSGPTARRYAVVQATDHDFITAMFSLYAQGRSRIL